MDFIIKKIIVWLMAISMLLSINIFSFAETNIPSIPTQEGGTADTPIVTPEETESAVPTKPAVVFNYLAFPLGITDENVKYIMESTQFPITNSDEFDIDLIEPARILNYDFSLAEQPVVVQLKDVKFDVEFHDKMAVTFTFYGNKTKELRYIALWGQIVPMSREKDIMALFSEIFSQLGAGDPDVEYRAEASQGGSNRYYAKGKTNGVSFDVILSGGDSSVFFDGLTITYGQYSG